jgi:GNAT superfamily N-acetyltransferase
VVLGFDDLQQPGHCAWRRGRRLADRTLVGFAALRAGSGIIAHTGEVGPLMVDPGLQRSGFGTVLMDTVLDLAREKGLERLSLSARDGHELPAF